MYWSRAHRQMMMITLERENVNGEADRQAITMTRRTNMIYPHMTTKWTKRTSRERRRTTTTIENPNTKIELITRKQNDNLTHL